MRTILQRKGLRFIFIANMVSMLGSGMNTSAVAWHILRVTHSELALGTLAAAQTLPALLVLPFTGVLIDREDRRRLVMMLDALRAIVIAVVAVLAFTGRAKVWELYAMSVLVSAGFWVFWPSITALVQELTPEDEFVNAAAEVRPHRPLTWGSPQDDADGLLDIGRAGAEGDAARP